MAAIDQREFEILSQFRLRLADLELNDEWSSDYCLIRWIRGFVDGLIGRIAVSARDHDLNAAEKMLRTSIKWRRDNNIHQILSWDPTTAYRKKYPYHIGDTRDNGVFVVCVAGRDCLKPLAGADEDLEYFMKYIYLIFEEVASKLKGRENSSGIPVTQITLLFDLHDFTITSTLSLRIIQVIKNFATYFDANEPERLKVAYLLDASKVVSLLLSLLKPIMAKKTLAKFTPVDTDPIKCKEKLLEIISEEELPMLYGGKQANSLVNKYIN